MSAVGVVVVMTVSDRAKSIGRLGLALLYRTGGWGAISALDLGARDGTSIFFFLISTD